MVDSNTRDPASDAVNPLSADWFRHQFNHFAPELADQLIPTLANMRADSPLTYSQEFGGFWIATRYKDIQRIALDWESFSSEQGMVVPYFPDMIKIPVIPEAIDPPQHGYFKELITRHLTPQAVAAHIDATRHIINELMGDFIDQGHCEFMEAFAKPMPGRILFERYLNAPHEDLAELTELASVVSAPLTEESFKAREEILEWVKSFVKQRQQQPRRDDLVDTILHADINGRPITDIEVLGIIQLVIFGGLDTTSGALGHMMLRFCQQPDIAKQLAEQPERIPAAVDELLRLDCPFTCIARTATRDVDIGGQTIKQGQRVLMYWQSANHDEEVFDNAQAYDLDRNNSKRHMSFGTGTHRCAGANLALLNLRLSIEALVTRLGHFQLIIDTSSVQYHPGFSRAPKQVPIRFTCLAPLT